MNTGRQIAASLLILALGLSVACNKKKKPQLPQQAQAPTIEVPLPDEISEATPPPSPPQPTQETAPPPIKPKSQPHKRRKPPAQPPANGNAAGNANGNAAGNANGNATIAAAHPPANPAAEAAPDTAIAADVSNAQATQQKQTTAQLLESSEKNLKGLHSGLSHDEEAMVAQIKTYIAQSRSATADKDFERAYNLALKAHLLSDALVKK